MTPQLYKIKNQESGKYLTAISGTAKMKAFMDGANQLWEKELSGDIFYLKVYDDFGSVYLHFLGLDQNVELDSTRKSALKLPDADAGTFYISNTDTDYVLAQDGSGVFAKQKDGSDAKKWVFEHAIMPSSQFYKIKNQESGKYLTAFSGTVRMEAFMDGTNQKWFKETFGDIINLKVTVDGGSVYLHFLGLDENVEVDSSRKSAIKLYDADAGTFYISDTDTDYVLAQDGSGVYAKKKDGSDAKKWVFELTTI